MSQTVGVGWRFIGVLAASAVALIAACGSSEPSTAERLRDAARAELDRPFVVAEFMVSLDGAVFASGLETFEPSTGHTDLRAADADAAFYIRPPLLHIDGDDALGETGGRLMTHEQAAIREFGDTRLGELSSLVVDGLLGRYLVSLAQPDDVTTIGRAVVNQRATTHLLVESSRGEFDHVAEVWLSDDGALVRIEYLTSGRSGEIVEVRLDLVTVPGVRMRSVAASDTVTAKQLEAEAAAERERLEQEERERALEEEELAAITEEMERERREAAESAEAELGDDLSDELGAWLTEWWSDPAASVFGEVAFGHVCVDTSPRMGIEQYVTCLELPPSNQSEPICEVAGQLDATFRHGPTMRSWRDAATSFVTAISDPVIVVGALGYEIVDDPPRAVLTGRGTVELLRAEAESISTWLNEGLSDHMVDYSVWLATSQIDAVCVTALEFPGILLNVLDEYEAAALERILDDPLSVHLPIGVGESGEHVAELQRILIEIGVGAGASGADGQFGPATAGAVGNVQYQWGIETTEIVGIETLAALRSEQAILESGRPCPSGEEIAAQLGPEEVAGGSAVTIDDVRCLSTFYVTLATFQLTTGSGPTEYWAAWEGHVYWIEIASEPTSERRCSALAERLPTYDIDDIDDALRQLGC